MSAHPAVTDPVRRWVRSVLADDATFTALPGGQTGSMFLVRSGGQRAVLRSVSPVAWGPEASRHIDSERLGCLLLADRDVPAPTLIAADVDGSIAGMPSSLTSWLDGEIRLDRLGPSALEALARVAVAVHTTPVPADQRPRPYALWTPGRIKVPTFATRPALWDRAIALFDDGTPPTPPALVHRDFHPGNVLWHGDEVTGLIDWAETAWGPADLDVAHCCTNLALLHGVGAAVAFRDAYRSAGGHLDPDPRASAYWLLADLFGFLPDPMHHLGALLRNTRTTSADLGFRLEQLLQAIVDGLIS